MSNSKLVSYTRISPNSSARTAPISKITIHHAAVINASLVGLGNGFAQPSRQASSNYGIDSNGKVGLYVDESRRAWTSSNAANDNVAVTIEVANCKGAPNWEVSAEALAATIELCADICKRNGIKKLNFTGDKSGNLTAHKYFAATACPGNYLYSKFPYIAAEVNKRLGASVETKEEQAAMPTVKEWQLAAIADGFAFPQYGADGIWGAECDAVAKKAVVKKRLYYSYPNLTKIVQRIVGAEIDGKCGSETSEKIIKYQAANGLEADGEVGINTWRSMFA